MPMLRVAIACRKCVRDFVSRELFVEILEAEEDHVAFLEIQLDPIPDSPETYIRLRSGPTDRRSPQ